MRTLLTFFLLLAGLRGNAQNGHWYFQPNISIGAAQSISNDYIPPSERHPLFAYRAGLGLGYTTGRWQLGTGIDFMTTGFGVGHITLADSFGNPVATSTHFHYRYFHIGIPLTAGYAIRLQKAWQFVPTFGLEPTYNAGAHASLIVVSPGSMGPGMVSKEAFDKSFRRFSLFGLVQAEFRHRLNDHAALFFGPAFRCMVTPLGKTYGHFRSRQRESLLSLDLGLSLQL